MKRILKFLTYYNFANIIIIFLYELIKSYPHIIVLRPFIMVFYALIGAYSYVLLPAIIVSLVLVVGYFIRALSSKNKNKGETYTLLFLNLFNLLGTLYCSLIALTQLGV